MKVAIVHEWLTTLGGSEKVVLEFKKIFPEAPIYTLVFNEEKLGNYFDKNEVITSYLQHIPLAKKKHQLFLSFMPKAFERFDLREYDLILTSSSAFAKGVISSPKSIHICYCHTPPRYIWDLSYEYLKDYNFLVRWYLEKKFHYLRMWDTLAANRVDYFIANSNYIANRIKKFYKREAKVIYPPVDVQYFTPSYEKVEDFYLIVSRLVSYKRVDLAVEVFNRISKKLIVIGDGPEYKKLKAMAKRNIEFMGFQPDSVIREMYRKCKALIFPGVEDFGIVPVEVQACGRPVIAYKEGGVLETVIENKTGIFFDKQDVESLIKAIGKFEKEIDTFDSRFIRKNAERFGQERFREQIKNFIFEIVGDKT
ncbi:glycosyl transferase group 1 [Caldicellulosiruptor acetigenus I77R1B]|uniref:Glycosyl transferase group 1 n=1 Tax=Caldicellulosiruptor acetigenus (strain ATCC 700853 / DSM 12137 / I77R1B) TaxID=632335 RepID=E4S805_CALA7|nr:glycosyltransferase [Caldicellulosiruptor acetigenus]ADQ41905.1 glycosyl transferase group 1 [Caldicellulosiruptor acetigenus I77R1B]